MNEKKLTVLLEAIATHIDQLNSDIYVLKFRNEELKKENEDLKARVQFFMDELKAREADDGIL